jgi:cytochrome d ubiquinol oxidase subunit I
VIGPLMAYEVLTAFFLEAVSSASCCWAQLASGQGAAFRRHRHGRDRHADLGVLDPRGQQLDADAEPAMPSTPNGQFVAADWFAVIFNPSFPYRLVHMVLAAYLTTALVVGAVGAWHLLRDQQCRRRA